ncbi:MAG: hypothetical protein H6834_12430 [Planctomycetes bacterium]|nr:hypothetical protein [Planctomycetota bacterium]
MLPLLVALSSPGHAQSIPPVAPLAEAPTVHMLYREESSIAQDAGLKHLTWRPGHSGPLARRLEAGHVIDHDLTVDEKHRLHAAYILENGGRYHIKLLERLGSPLDLPYLTPAIPLDGIALWVDADKMVVAAHAYDATSNVGTLNLYYRHNGTWQSWVISDAPFNGSLWQDGRLYVFFDDVGMIRILDGIRIHNTPTLFDRAFETRFDPASGSVLSTTLLSRPGARFALSLHAASDSLAATHVVLADNAQYEPALISSVTGWNVLLALPTQAGFPVSLDIDVGAVRGGASKMDALAIVPLTTDGILNSNPDVTLWAMNINSGRIQQKPILRDTFCGELRLHRLDPLYPQIFIACIHLDNTYSHSVLSVVHSRTIMPRWTINDLANAEFRSEVIVTFPRTSVPRDLHIELTY